MQNEPLKDGGRLVALANGGIGVEDAPGAKRGLIVESACRYMDDGVLVAGRYRLTQRVVSGGTLWRARRLPRSL